MSLVQVWLSSLIEFHTQNGVSKWPGRLARWSATPPSLCSLLSRGSLSHVYTPHGIWLQLGVVHVETIAITLIQPRGEQKNDRRRTTDGERETARQTTQVSTPTPAAFLCFTCRWVSRVLTWFAFWTPRSEPSSHQTVNISLRMWLQGSTSEMKM